MIQSSVVSARDCKDFPNCSKVEHDIKYNTAAMCITSHLENGWQSDKKSVLERNSHMFNNPFMSDITLTCGEDVSMSFHAHKYVLAISSPVFYAMFFGSMAQNILTLHLCDIDNTSFKEFLRFLYTDEIKLTIDNALPLLYLAKKYLVYNLIEKCMETIYANLTPENVLNVLENRMLFDKTDIEKRCWDTVDRFTSTVVKSDQFNDINHSTLISIVKRDTLNISEVELFEALLQWGRNQCWNQGVDATFENTRKMLGNFIYEIRILSMTKEQFLNNVASSGLLTTEEITMALKRLNMTDKTNSKWLLKKRQIHHASLKCIARFFPGDIKAPTRAWSYTNSTPDKLSFTVNRTVLLHGVRMFGDDNNSTYDASIDVLGTTVSGRYTSQLLDDGIYGYDVMLSKPVTIYPDAWIIISANISGPNSYYGNNGQRMVEVDGISVRFGDTGGSWNGTNVKLGQFERLILSLPTESELNKISSHN